MSEKMRELFEKWLKDESANTNWALERETARRIDALTERVEKLERELFSDKQPAEPQGVYVRPGMRIEATDGLPRIVSERQSDGKFRIWFANGDDKLEEGVVNPMTYRLCGQRVLGYEEDKSK